MSGHSPAALQLQQPRQQEQQEQQQEDEEKQQQTNSASPIERAMQAISTIGKSLESMSDGLQDTAELLAGLLAKIDHIKRDTSAGKTAKLACRLALDIVDGERVSYKHIDVSSRHTQRHGIDQPV